MERRREEKRDWTRLETTMKGRGKTTGRKEMKRKCRQEREENKDREKEG